MNKIYKLIIFILLTLPMSAAAFATTSVPWIATSTAFIQPNKINGIDPYLYIPNTGTSTFAGNISVTGNVAAGRIIAPIVTSATGQVSISGSGNCLLVNTNTLVVNCTNGRVGIGTTTPNQKLDVSVSSGANMVLERPGVGTYNFGIGGGAVGSDIGDLQVTPQTASSGYLFQTSNASNVTVNALAIDRIGNIGIGTTTPTVPLQVTTPSANATTSVEIGKANQTKGSCLVMYDVTGAVQYVSIVSGAFVISSTSCK